MGSGLVKRYQAPKAAPEQDTWRKPKPKAGAKVAADPSPSTPSKGSQGTAARSATSSTSAAKVAERQATSWFKDSAERAPAAENEDDEDDDMAGFSNLADAAAKVWEDLTHQRDNTKDFKTLFGLSELKDAVERAAKRVEFLRREAQLASATVAHKTATLEELCAKFEERILPHAAPLLSRWKLGDLVIRRQKGLCEISMVHHQEDPPFFEVRMAISGSVVGTEASKLLELTPQQQSVARTALRELDQAKLCVSKADEALVQAEEDIRLQHQSLIDQVEKKLEDTSTSKASQNSGPDGRAAPMGFPSMEHMSKMEKQQASAPPVTVYPDMKGVKEDLRGRAGGGAAGPGSSVSGRPQEVLREDTRSQGTGPPPAGGGSSASGRENSSSGQTAPTGFPSFEALGKMDKQAQERQAAQEAAQATQTYPSVHSGAVREVFSRPEGLGGAPQDSAQHKTGVQNNQQSQSPAAASHPSSKEPNGIPFGFPKLDPGAEPHGAPQGPPQQRASLQQVKQQQEETLRQQQEALRQQQEAVRLKQEAERKTQQSHLQRQEAERKQQEAYQQQQAAKQQQQQAPQQPQAHKQPDWVVYRAADGQAYYHNERTNQTAWTLPAGAACREPGQPGAAAQGAQQAAEDDPFAYLRQQEEDLRKQREEYAQWYAQYSAWYAQQQATGAAQGSEAGAGSGEKHGSGAQQSQGGPKDGAQGGPSGAAKDRVPLRGPAPPKLDAGFDDHATYAIKSSVLKEMEAMVSQGRPLAERKKALRCMQMRWHPDKNPDKPEVAKNVFQFMEETKPWFLHDHEAQDAGS